MELLEAIQSRRSIRAYKSDPVPREVLTELLEVARWAPSGTNTQPWEFIVLTGKVLNELSHTRVEKVRSGDMKPHPDIEMLFTIPPKGLYGKRQQKFFKQVLDLIEPEEGKNKMQKWLEQSVSNYGAPARIIIVADKSAPGWFIFDTGSITQTIALAAQEYGLGTCILGDAAVYPEEVRRIAKIPESKQVIIGIAIGYPDWDHPLNSLRTEREPVEKLVTWRGMAEEGEKTMEEIKNEEQKISKMERSNINNLKKKIEIQLFESVECDKKCPNCLTVPNKDCDNMFINALKYSLGGKDDRIRPTLMSLFGELYKKEEISINIALAFECMHNSALILDDIFDNAEYRNGKKCTYLAFSKPTAILVSSYLIFKGFQFLGQMKDHVDYENFIRIHQIFVSYSQNIIKGAFEKNTLRAKEHTKENYFDVLNATASHITSVGFKAIATVITDDPHFIINAQKFGSYLGCLLQIKNDILDIYGYESNDYTLQDIKNNDPNILISLLSRYANENISCENVYGIIDRNNIKNEALYIAENYYKGCVDCIPKLVPSKHQNRIECIVDGIMEDISKILNN